MNESDLTLESLVLSTTTKTHITIIDDGRELFSDHAYKVYDEQYTLLCREVLLTIPVDRKRMVVILS